MLDGALRATFRNFSTLFLLVALVTVPLHVAHAYFFRQVIAVDELHGAIERFPEGRQVRRVGVEELRDARLGLLGLSLLEVALLPVALSAAQHALATPADEVPTVWGAWLGVRRGAPAGLLPPAAAVPSALVGAGLALLVGVMARAVGLLLVESLSDPVAFAGVGLVEGTSRALAGAFLLGVAGAAALRAKDT
ncbi:MAG: hypothetical protein ABR529_13700 [Actinomycetota bacterium]